MLVTLQGQVLAVDDSAYRLPPSDTLSYVVSSMLSFVDTMPRYRIKVIDKFVTVEDRRDSDATSHCFLKNSTE